MSYGDDNIMSVSSECDWFNQRIMNERLARIGITYTAADKSDRIVEFEPFSKFEFVKRGARFEPAVGLWVAPLLETSIAKSLHVIVKSKTISLTEQAAETLRAAAYHYFLHGEEVYTRRIEQLMEIAKLMHLDMHLLDVAVPFCLRAQKYRRMYGIHWCSTKLEHYSILEYEAPLCADSEPFCLQHLFD
jgi:uncharacterized protein YacL (UPF0231 family)